MNKTIAKIKLSGVFPYLAKRAKLRFLSVNKNNAFQPTTILGHEVILDLNDLEQKYFASDCIREPENLFVYRAISDSGLVNTFIDIGANCGHVASSIVSDYSNVLLFEPNPKLAELLRTVFSDKDNVTIKECAIVDDESTGELLLTVPDESSGLATLGATTLSDQHEKTHEYSVKASTLEEEAKDFDIDNAYIKIDIEGFEKEVIQSAKELINTKRPIVGFEALSKEAATTCAEMFDNYAFYCSRFDFLENGGALSNSISGISKMVLSGANIEVLRMDNIANGDLRNFSQVYSVPLEKTSEFEEAITKYLTKNPSINLYHLSSWS